MPCQVVLTDWLVGTRAHQEPVNHLLSLPRFHGHGGVWSLTSISCLLVCLLSTGDLFATLSPPSAAVSVPVPTKATGRQASCFSITTLRAALTYKPDENNRTPSPCDSPFLWFLIFATLLHVLSYFYLIVFFWCCFFSFIFNFEKNK